MPRVFISYKEIDVLQFTPFSEFVILVMYGLNVTNSKVSVTFNKGQI